MIFDWLKSFFKSSPHLLQLCNVHVEVSDQCLFLKEISTATSLSKLWCEFLLAFTRELVSYEKSYVEISKKQTLHCINMFKFKCLFKCNKQWTCAWSWCDMKSTYRMTPVVQNKHMFGMAKTKCLSYVWSWVPWWKLILGIAVGDNVEMFLMVLTSSSTAVRTASITVFQPQTILQLL